MSLSAAQLKFTRQAINDIRERKDARLEDKVRMIFNHIDKVERGQLGSVYIHGSDGRPYWFDGASHTVYLISRKSGKFCAALLERYGLIYTEVLTNHVIAAMEGFTLQQGIYRDLRRWVCWNREEGALYVYRYDGTSYRLDGLMAPTIVNNGIGALFLEDDQGVTCNANIGPHGLLIPRLVDCLSFAPRTDGGLGPAQQRLLLIMWLFMLAFPDLCPTKPILMLEGSQGSGKTGCVKALQAALHGRVRPHILGKTDEKDFGIQILRSPICLLDNLDGYIPWLQDALCSYATTGEWARRSLYTNDDEFLIRPTSWIAVSTRNPATFRRADLADRTIIMRLKRRAQFVPEEEFLGALRADRERIYGEWLYYLNQIVAAINAPQPQRSSTHRMADFAKLGHIVGSVLNFAPGDIEKALAAEDHERDALTSEDDALVDMIDRWLGVQTNQGRMVTAGDLFAELQVLAHNVGREFPIPSARALASQVRDRQSALERFFDVKVGKDRKGNTYVFRRL